MAAPILNGNLSDWTSADVIDKTGSTAGYDVYGRESGGTFYFALKAPIAIGANTTVWFNTDQNTATGFQIFGNSGGAEYNINFDGSGIPRLYTGNAGATPVPGVTVNYAYSADRKIVEFSVPTSALGTPKIVGTLWDVNDGPTGMEPNRGAFLPGSYSGPQYDVTNGSALPARTDFSQKVGIVYSDTTSNHFWSPTGYSQLFMTVQNQVAMAGVNYEILTEADLTDLTKLANFDTLVFPSFSHVQSGQVTAIENALKIATRHYDIGLVTAGDFMTNSQTGASLSGDPYARMKSLLDLNITASGNNGDVTLKAANAHFAMQDYSAGEVIREYDGVSWLAYGSVSGIDASSLVTQTVNGVTRTAVIETNTGGRNIHFSTSAVMGDNNLLWQAVDYAVNGTGISAGIQLSRQTSIVATRNDMDQAMETYDVSPDDQPQGIYDKMLPILQQWKDTYNFVGSYYIDIGNDPPDQMTDWAKSGQYYAQMLAMGNEIGSHSYTHPHDTNLLTAGQIQAEFQDSKQEIAQQMSLILGRPFVVDGAAVPGAPENLATALQIIQYYDYLSGGYASVNAGYPGGFGYLNPAMAAQDKVYLAPNIQFDFSLVEFGGMTPAQAIAKWAAEVAELSKHSDVPVLLWPVHDYGIAAWDTNTDDEAPSPYTTDMFTQFISAAYHAGAEFVTLDDLAERISAFGDTKLTTSTSGNTVTATVASSDAGKFALDLDNIGANKIARVSGWYAYDDDSVFLDRDGGSYTIELGSTVNADDVTRITSLPMRSELISLTGDRTNLSFSIYGEGRIVIDLRAGLHPVVTGADIVSLVGDKLTLNLQTLAQHAVSVVTNEGTDLNADGRSDLVLYRAATGSVQPLLMDGVAWTAAREYVWSGWKVVGTNGDFNGDGKSDLVIHNAAKGWVQPILMDGVDKTEALVYGWDGWKVVSAEGDFNGDGKSDLVIHNAAQGWVQPILMDGVNKTEALVYDWDGWKVASAAGDFNGDGKSDLLMYKPATGSLQPLLMDGVTWTAAREYVWSGWKPVSAQGDFNGDGKSDLVISKAATGSLQILLMDGVNWTESRVYDWSGWKVASAAGDFNGDGKSDLLIHKAATGSLQVLLMDGVNWTASRVYEWSGWKVESAQEDFNGDGKSDLVIHNAATGSLQVLLMDGVNWTASQVYGWAGWRAVNSPEGQSISDFYGTAGNDTLSGTHDADSISGLGGSDRLTGGGGADRFAYHSVNEGMDTLVDFAMGGGGDVLDISEVLQGYAPDASNAASFIRLSPSGGNTIVSVNADGAGSDFVALAMLQNVAMSGNLLNDMLANGNLILS